jgi:phage terminase large subunit
MNNEIEIHTEVFNDIYKPYLQNTTPLQIYFGGSSSGKSVFLAQRCIYDLLNGKRNYLVCRQVSKTIQKSVAQEIHKVVKTWKLDNLFTINKTDGTITCKNGYQCIFSGLDDVEKLKSITPQTGVITDVWIEEATEIDVDSYKQLEKRLRGGSEETKKRITMSFNPILQSHWIYQTYFTGLAWADDQKHYDDADISILKTTYKDNKFLTKQDITRLENEKDKYYYDVYTLGNWGILGDVIFKNYVIADLSDPNSEYYLPDEQRTNRRHGLDFGFSNDPAALWMSHYDYKKDIIYIYDEFSERGLTNDQLAEEIIKRIGRDYVICDSAEPKSIQELCNYGVSAKPALKGKDSVNFGIQWFQQRLVVIDVKCVGVRNEWTTYHWKQDKDGNAMRVPSEKNNHFIDGGRYAYENDMVENWLVS